METNSTLVRTSRYVAGGTTEVGDNTIEWWDRAILTRSDTDIRYVVDKKFAGRLEMISDLFLGEPRWWWIIAQMNNILDPHNEVREGTLLFIPTADRAKSMLTGQLGGVASTRELTPSILPIV
jgi:hypothetical protein